MLLIGGSVVSILFIGPSVVRHTFSLLKNILGISLVIFGCWAVYYADRRDAAIKALARKSVAILSPPYLKRDSNSVQTSSSSSFWRRCCIGSIAGIGIYALIKAGNQSDGVSPNPSSNPLPAPMNHSLQSSSSLWRSQARENIDMQAGAHLSKYYLTATMMSLIVLGLSFACSYKSHLLIRQMNDVSNAASRFWQNPTLLAPLPRRRPLFLKIPIKLSFWKKTFIPLLRRIADAMKKRFG